MEKQFSIQRDPARKFKRRTVQHHKVDTRGQENLETGRRLTVEISRDVDIGIWPGTARRTATVQISKDGAVMLQRLDCSHNSLVNHIHRLIVALHRRLGDFQAR